MNWARHAAFVTPALRLGFRYLLQTFKNDAQRSASQSQFRPVHEILKTKRDLHDAKYRVRETLRAITNENPTNKRWPALGFDPNHAQVPSPGAEAGAEAEAAAGSMGGAATASLSSSEAAAGANAMEIEAGPEAATNVAGASAEMKSQTFQGSTEKNGKGSATDRKQGELDKREGAEMTGVYIRKEFPDHGDFDGAVTGCRWHKNKWLYKVRYADGDEEELTHREVCCYAARAAGSDETVSSSPGETGSEGSGDGAAVDVEAVGCSICLGLHSKDDNDIILCDRAGKENSFGFPPTISPPLSFGLTATCSLVNCARLLPCIPPTMPRPAHLG